jgi:hypothetical protein
VRQDGTGRYSGGKAIPEALEQGILEKAAEGWSTRKIAEWLTQEKGRPFTHNAVARLLKERRTERADIAQGIAREKLAPSICSDIDRLEVHAALLDQMGLALAKAVLDPANPAKERNPKGYVLVVEELRKITDTKLKYSGAGGSDDDGSAELAAAAAEVARRLGAEPAPGGAASSPPADSPDPEGPGSPSLHLGLLGPS